MKIKTLLKYTLVFFVLSCPLAAEETKTMSIPPHLLGMGRNDVSSVFAFPGPTCPVGSEIFKGPEAQMIKDSGAVYCVFKRGNVVALPKDKVPDGKCPPMFKTYEDKKYKPDADTIWCERPAVLTQPRPQSPK